MGYAGDAAALRVLGHAHQAWNEAHLSFHARNARLHNLLAVLRAGMQPDWTALSPQPSWPGAGAACTASRG
jgi:hypothetical protein